MGKSVALKQLHVLSLPAGNSQVLELSLALARTRASVRRMRLRPTLRTCKGVRLVASAMTRAPRTNIGRAQRDGGRQP